MQDPIVEEKKSATCPNEGESEHQEPKLDEVNKALESTNPMTSQSAEKKQDSTNPMNSQSAEKKQESTNPMTS